MKISLARLEDLNYEDAIRPYPYDILADTMRRMMFYHAAIATNKDAVLLFEEPDAHSFPAYIDQLGKMIRDDHRGNQFFLTTHSPYMLTALLSGQKRGDIQVFLTKHDSERGTYLLPLGDGDMHLLMRNVDQAFFNFDKFDGK